MAILIEHETSGIRGIHARLSSNAMIMGWLQQGSCPGK